MHQAKTPLRHDFYVIKTQEDYVIFFQNFCNLREKIRPCLVVFSDLLKLYSTQKRNKIKYTTLLGKEKITEPC